MEASKRKGIKRESKKREKFSLTPGRFAGNLLSLCYVVCCGRSCCCPHLPFLKNFAFSLWQRKYLECVYMIYDLHPLFLPLFLPHPLRLIRNGNSDIALPTLDGRYWDIMFLFPGRDCWYAPCLAFSHSRMVMFWTVWRLSCLRLVTRFSASKTI